MAMRSVPALVRASMRVAPSTVSTPTVATNHGLPRSATEYRHSAYTSRPAGTYTAEKNERGPMATDVQASPTADAPQATAGNRVRSRSGAQTRKPKRSSTTVL